MDAVTRPRRYRVEAQRMLRGVKMKLGINREAGGGAEPTYHTFATPHLPDDDAEVFMEMLQAGARVLGITLTIERGKGDARRHQHGGGRG